MIIQNRDGSLVQARRPRRFVDVLNEQRALMMRRVLAALRPSAAQYIRPCDSSDCVLSVQEQA